MSYRRNLHKWITIAAQVISIIGILILLLLVTTSCQDASPTPVPTVHSYMGRDFLNRDRIISDLSVAHDDFFRHYDWHAQPKNLALLHYEMFIIERRQDSIIRMLQRLEDYELRNRRNK